MKNLSFESSPTDCKVNVYASVVDIIAPVFGDFFLYALFDITSLEASRPQELSLARVFTLMAVFYELVIVFVIEAIRAKARVGKKAMFVGKNI